MLKRFIPLSISVAALLAFAAPAAQATDPLITNSLGQAAKTITAQSTNTQWLTPNTTIQCRTAHLHGNITTNGDTTAEGRGTGTARGTVGGSHTGHCGSSMGNVHFDAVALYRIHLERIGGTVGLAELAFTFRFTTILGTAHCTLETDGAAVIVTGASSMKIKGILWKVAPSGALCPSESDITGDFTVRDEFGKLVTIH